MSGRVLAYPLVDHHHPDSHLLHHLFRRRQSFLLPSLPTTATPLHNGPQPIGIRHGHLLLPFCALAARLAAQTKPHDKGPDNETPCFQQRRDVGVTRGHPRESAQHPRSHVSDHLPFLSTCRPVQCASKPDKERSNYPHGQQPEFQARVVLEEGQADKHNVAHHTLASLRAHHGHIGIVAPPPPPRLLHSSIQTLHPLFALRPHSRRQQEDALQHVLVHALHILVEGRKRERNAQHERRECAWDPPVESGGRQRRQERRQGRQERRPCCCQSGWGGWE